MVLVMACPTIEASNITHGKWFALQAIAGEGSSPHTQMVGVTKWSQVITHDALTLESHQKAITIIVMAVNLIVGLFYRIILYKNVHKNGVLSRPINLMICIDETVKMCGFSSWIFFVGSNFFLDKPLYTYTGELFCHATNYVIVMGIYHYVNGGFGIALMRVVFVQFPANIPVSQIHLALFISITTLASTIAGSYVWVISPKRSQDLTSLCFATSSDYHEVYFYYTSDHSFLYEGRVVAFSLIGQAYIFVVCEAMMYASLFRFLNKHDKSMRMLLSENVIKGRLKKNAIDLTGHTINFAMESIWLAGLAAGGYWWPHEYKWLIRCFNISAYGTLSAVHILFSAALRDECVEIHTRLNEFASWLRNSIKSQDG